MICNINITIGNYLSRKGFRQTTRRREKDRSGNEVEIRYGRRAKYFPKNKHIALIESKIFGDEVSQGYLKVYRDDGTKIFETKVEPDKDGDYMSYEDVRVLGNHHVITIASKYIGENKRRMDIYNISNNEVIFSTSLLEGSFVVPPSEDYILLSIKNPKTKHVQIYKYDFASLKKVVDDEGLFVESFSNNGKSCVIGKTNKTNKNAPSGNPLYKYSFSFFTNDSRKSLGDTGEFEYPVKTWYSVKNRYVVFSSNKDVVKSGNKITSTKTYYFVFDTNNGDLVSEGKLSPETLEKYNNETIHDKGKP